MMLALFMVLILKYLLTILRLLPLSWYFGDSSHGDGLMEGLDGVRRWVQLEIV
jgi:hypothetical protein